ncbi:MAG: histidine phosphatase family protein [Symploca sp. SIO2E9]|nr:histidine phosphatase family protein [Symploca sp. SIO2E9]
MSSRPNTGLCITNTSSTRVILVRQGGSNYNEQGIYQGSGNDSVLTPQGHNNAFQTGIALKELDIEATYVSRSQRAQQTAIEILAAMNTDLDNLCPVHVHDKLQEISMHVWEGLPLNYVQEQFAQQYRSWQEQPHKFQIRKPQNTQTWHANVETLHATSVQISRGNLAVANSPKQQFFPVLDLYEQAKQFWQEILPRHVGQTVLIVSHGGTNRALISTAINLRPECYHTLQQSNCGINILNFSVPQIQQAQLEVLNLTTQLGETLPKLNKGKQGLRLLLLPSDGIDLCQTRMVAEFLKHESINFSLSSDLASSHATAQGILKYHPAAIQFQVLRDDFPQAWQQVILSRRSSVASEGMDPTNLITGLVVASESIIKSILSQVLGLKSDQFWRLQLSQGGVSVIHYPATNCSPVLQAMNITGF